MVYEVTGKRYLLRIGRAGEQYASEFVVNIQPWLDLWPNGQAAVLIQRPDDDYFYTAANVVQDNDAGTVTWSPDATDTAQATTKKALQMQVVFTSNNTVIARAPIWSCRIESSLIDDTVDPPDVNAQWFMRILNAAELVYAAAANADAWRETWEWVLEDLDRDYPLVPNLLTVITDVCDYLSNNVRIEDETLVIETYPELSVIYDGGDSNNV